MGAIEEFAETVESEGSGDAPEHQDADHESEVTDAIGEEGFLCRVGGGVFFIPMSDKEVGTESD